MVLVSGWLDGPVWVALERHWVRLQTVSIPLDRGCKTGWETAALPFTQTGDGPMRRRPGVEDNRRGVKTLVVEI